MEEVQSEMEPKHVNDNPNDDRFDLIILGASGFTGKYVLREALKFLNINNPSSPLKSIALAGRNPTKLTQALQWATRPNPPPHSHHHNRRHNRPIVPSGPLRPNPPPPQLRGPIPPPRRARRRCLRRIRLRLPRHLRRARIHGADGSSLPRPGLGNRQWVGSAVPNQVEAYVSLESEKRIVGNFATYESAVLGVANANKLQELRRSRPRRARPMIPGPPPSKGETIENQKKIGLWAVKLPSADSVVVRRTLAILTENPHGLPGLNESADMAEKREAFWSSVKAAHFGVKIGSKSLLGILRIIMVGIFIGLLGSTGFGRWLLLKFPSVFSLGWFRKNGPSEEEVESASFKMWFVGRGFSNESLASQGNTKPDMEIITRVMGPEIGYLTTPIILIQCALILLSQRNNLPKGGVYTPGIIFGPTDLQERLQQNGIF
ncbi:putative mitochondrial saccharopine dehydrogenase-like [Sesbania bispinosa]|nr:putative mitochondrial saccharopine dehydrogenase-like [Sesbania bispinosa]